MKKVFPIDELWLVEVASSTMAVGDPDDGVVMSVSAVTDTIRL